MSDFSLVCYEDMGDISERRTDIVDIFSNAFRCNHVISSVSHIDEYIVAGAFIVLVRRSTIPPSDYHLWILPSVIISWYILEESIELTYQIERICGNDVSNDHHRKAMSLSAAINWNIFIEIEEINEVVSRIGVVCKDILRTRDTIPSPIGYV